MDQTNSNPQYLLNQQPSQENLNPPQFMQDDQRQPLSYMYQQQLAERNQEQINEEEQKIEQEVQNVVVNQQAEVFNSQIETRQNPQQYQQQENQQIAENKIYENYSQIENSRRRIQQEDQQMQQQQRYNGQDNMANDVQDQVENDLQNNQVNFRPQQQNQEQQQFPQQYQNQQINYQHSNVLQSQDRYQIQERQNLQEQYEQQYRQLQRIEDAQVPNTNNEVRQFHEETKQQQYQLNQKIEDEPQLNQNQIIQIQQVQGKQNYNQFKQNEKQIKQNDDQFKQKINQFKQNIKQFKQEENDKQNLNIIKNFQNNQKDQIEQINLPENKYKKSPIINEVIENALNSQIVNNNVQEQIQIKYQNQSFQEQYLTVYYQSQSSEIKQQQNIQDKRIIQITSGNQSQIKQSMNQVKQQSIQEIKLEQVKPKKAKSIKKKSKKKQENVKGSEFINISKNIKGHKQQLQLKQQILKQNSNNFSSNNKSLITQNKQSLSQSQQSQIFLSSLTQNKKSLSQSQYSQVILSSLSNSQINQNKPNQPSKSPENLSQTISKEANAPIIKTNKNVLLVLTKQQIERNIIELAYQQRRNSNTKLFVDLVKKRNHYFQKHTKILDDITYQVRNKILETNNFITGTINFFKQVADIYRKFSQKTKTVIRLDYLRDDKNQKTKKNKAWSNDITRGMRLLVESKDAAGDRLKSVEYYSINTTTFSLEKLLKQYNSIANKAQSRNDQLKQIFCEKQEKVIDRIKRVQKKFIQNQKIKDKTKKDFSYDLLQQQIKMLQQMEDSKKQLTLWGKGVIYYWNSMITNQKSIMTQFQNIIISYLAMLSQIHPLNQNLLQVQNYWQKFNAIQEIDLKYSVENILPLMDLDFLKLSLQITSNLVIEKLQLNDIETFNEFSNQQNVIGSRFFLLDSLIVRSFNCQKLNDKKGWDPIIIASTLQQNIILYNPSNFKFLNKMIKVRLCNTRKDDGVVGINEKISGVFLDSWNREIIRFKNNDLAEQFLFFTENNQSIRKQYIV